MIAIWRRLAIAAAVWYLGDGSTSVRLQTVVIAWWDRVSSYYAIIKITYNGITENSAAERYRICYCWYWSMEQSTSSSSSSSPSAAATVAVAVAVVATANTDLHSLHEQHLYQVTCHWIPYTHSERGFQETCSAEKNTKHWNCTFLFFFPLWCPTEQTSSCFAYPGTVLMASRDSDVIWFSNTNAICITSFMVPTWGTPVTDRTQVCPIRYCNSRKAYWCDEISRSPVVYKWKKIYRPSHWLPTVYIKYFTTHYQ